MKEQQDKGDGIKIIKPSLPKGGGAIQGMGEAFSADEFMGSAALSIPLPVSPCRGSEPRLSLDYNSRSGHSVFGNGFDLSLPSISRLTSLGTPRYDGHDTFVLSGSDFLVPELGLNDQPVVKAETIAGKHYQVFSYIPRVEKTFSLIKHFVNLDDNTDQFWQVSYADNSNSIYGKSDSARIFDPDSPSSIFEWKLEEHFDDKGNHVVYVYQKENTDGLSPDELNNNRDHKTNTYITHVKYGNDQPILDGSLVTGQSATALANVLWHFEIVFDYGQYNVSVDNKNIYEVQKGSVWTLRHDPYSRYDAGFEIRTLRRCCNVLLFHRFEQNNQYQPTLTEQLHLEYNTAPDYNEHKIREYTSQLSEAVHSGYTFKASTTQAPYYQKKSLPALKLDYTPFLPFTKDYKPADFDTCVMDDNAIPDITNYRSIDLYGVGIPGLLYADGESVFYRETEKVSEDAVHYGTPQAIAFPPGLNDDARHTLMDVNGDGKLDLMVSQLQQAGLYEMGNNHRWGNFQAFSRFPLDYHEPSIEHVDVTGDGLADVVMIEDRCVRMNTLVGNVGYAHTAVVEKQEQLPSSKPNAEFEMLEFANLLGAGSPQRVRIANGLVECWPNLAYGKFGKKVSMKNAPYFGADFTTQRLLLADIDGSGLIDIAYIYPDRVDIYMNQSGNGFAKTPVSVLLPASWDPLCQIEFVDIKGNGTSCLLFRKPHYSSRQWFFDFNQSINSQVKPQVPYLLQTIDNNRGATTSLQYTSSSEFYLADKAAGIPWVTTQAAAINVLSSVTHTDAIAKTSATASYRYHHGYFDGTERTFRGFGCVEKTDASSFADFMPANTGEEAAYQAPSAYTRTWYHTGATLQAPALMQQYQKEYWQGDSHAYDFPATVFDYLGNTAPLDEAVRESHRALYGMALRTEIYARDATPWQDVPEQVNEIQHEVVQLQVKGANKYAVFRVDGKESIEYDYARNANDPRIAHSFTLEVDQYGRTLQTCAVNYGRRADQIPHDTDPQTGSQQTQLWVTYESHQFLNTPALQPGVDFYYLGIPIENKAYEIKGLTPKTGDYFSFADIKQQITTALINEESDGAHAKLQHWLRHYYYDAHQQKELPLKQIANPLLSHRTENISFDIDKLTDEFSYVAATTLDNLLTAGDAQTHDAKGGYIRFTNPKQSESSDADELKYYWNPGSAQDYDGDHFFLPLHYYDPFQYEKIYYGAPTPQPAQIPHTAYHYDEYHLMVTQVTDPLGNKTILSEIDYQRLHPAKMTDINGNSSSVLLDPLGMVIVSSRSGEQIGKDGKLETLSFKELSQYMLVTKPDLQEMLETDPQKYLQGMASFFYYDLDNWQQNNAPAYSIQLNYDDYTLVDGEPKPTKPAIQKHIVYSDGFGRVLQSKAYLDDSEEPNWVTSGAVRYDNKGQPIKQFEPYFTAGYDYEEKQFGVATTVFYGGLGEKLLSLSPEGFINKILAGNLNGPQTPPPTYSGWLNQKLYSPEKGFQPCVWSSLAFDADDTSAESDYTPKADADVDAAAFAKAKVFANTPVQTLSGSTGHVVQGCQLNVSTDETNAQYSQYNIWGQELSSADQRLHANGLFNFTTSYNLLNIATMVDSADAGKRWTLHDVVGNIIYQRDSRLTETYQHYDVLHRPITTFVKNTTTDKTSPLYQLHNRVKKISYGDSVDSAGHAIFPEAKKYNLLGRPYIALDEAGLEIIPGCDVLGFMQYGARWIKGDYKHEADWSNINDDAVKDIATAITGLPQLGDIGSITLPNMLSSLLMDESFVVKQTHDAIGRQRSSVDADGNSTTQYYFSTNWLKGEQVEAGHKVKAANPDAKAPGILKISYNPKGQPENVTYGNKVQTSYHYDPYNFRLTRIESTKADNTLLQKLTYHHDPVGNVTSVTNDVLPTVFFNNQQVEPKASYTYDALYRLIEATGREHSGMWQNDQANQNKFNQAFFTMMGPQLSDNQALQNYTQHYHYDTGNNLTQLKHSSQTGSSLRQHTIEKNNNRLQSSLFAKTETTFHYDDNGNMQTLEGTANVAWNYRNNMASATGIVRDASEDDSEYYIYDGAGQRVRKVSETNTGSVVNIDETLYVGGIEIRRQGTRNDEGEISTKQDWHSVRLMQGDSFYCSWRYWVIGTTKPEEKKIQLRYQLNDLLKSSQFELDEAANTITFEEYYPYGGTSIMAGRSQNEVKNKHYQYSGKEKDITGLYYYGARYYAPWLGRWTSTDPAGTIDGLNLYTFVNGNPVTQVDVGGMCGKGPLTHPKMHKPFFDIGVKMGGGLIGLPFEQAHVYTWHLHSLLSFMLHAQAQSGMQIHDTRKLESAMKKAAAGNQKTFEKDWRTANPYMDEHLSTVSVFHLLRGIESSVSTSLHPYQTTLMKETVFFWSMFRLPTNETGFNFGGKVVQHPSERKLFFGTKGQGHGHWDRWRRQWVMGQLRAHQGTGYHLMVDAAFYAALHTMNQGVAAATASNVTTLPQITDAERKAQVLHQEAIKDSLVQFGAKSAGSVDIAAPFSFHPLTKPGNQVLTMSAGDFEVIHARMSPKTLAANLPSNAGGGN